MQQHSRDLHSTWQMRASMRGKAGKLMFWGPIGLLAKGCASLRGTSALLFAPDWRLGMVIFGFPSNARDAGQLE